MSFDPSGLRSSSPASSGRASPIHRFRPKPGEDGLNLKDKAFRRYALAVERALGSFDTAQQEWADYISFLSRLLKALQTHPPGCHAVPESHMVATRLAQCLNATLPSGVHQKALEVYGFVFTIIGPLNLARDLHVYFPGLSPVLSFASLSVRPLFLSLFEEHIATLDSGALRSALKSVVLCLLPGLEDETSEDFDRVLHILDKFRGTALVDEVNPDLGRSSNSATSRTSFFWQCFFLAAITNSSRRQGALSYLTRHLPKFATQRASNHEQALETLLPDAQCALSPEPGLLIRCFAAGLSDKQALVQRGFLDLLVTHLPLDSAVLQHAVPSADLDRLIFSAVGVVSRRDMSLNRRLWSWFLGPERKIEAQKMDAVEELKIMSPGADAAQYHAAYFARHGLRALTRSILALLSRRTSIAAERAKPFRICLSLMDRWEVGGLLIPHVFIPALRYAFDYDQNASKRDSEEVLKSASNFFDGVESGLIWAKITELAETALTHKDSSPMDKFMSIRLCHFILQRFNLREEEMVLHHMPLTALFILMLSNQHSADELDTDIHIFTLEIVEKLIAMIPQRAFQSHRLDSKRGSSRSSENSDSIFAKIKTFYEEDQGSIENDLPAPSSDIAEHLLRQATELFTCTISRIPYNSPAVDLSTKIICGLIRSVPEAHGILAGTNLLSALRSVLDSESREGISFAVLHAAATALVALQGESTSKSLLHSRDRSAFQDTLVRLLWQHLDYAVPKYHVEAARTLWHMELADGPGRTIEASITSLMTTKSVHSPSNLDACRRFSVLWAHSMQERTGAGEKVGRSLSRRTSAHTGSGNMSVLPVDPAFVLSRPLLVVLDFLEDGGSEEAAFVSTWLDQLPSLAKVFELLVSQIRKLKCIRKHAKGTTMSRKAHLPQNEDRGECFCFLRHVFRIIQSASEHTWIVLAGDVATPLVPTADNDDKSIALHELIIQICMQILTVVDFTSLQHGHTDLERMALKIIQLIIEGPFSAPLKELELEIELLNMLRDNLQALEPQLQATFLSTITACLRLRTKTITMAPLSPTDQRLTGDRRSSSQGNLLKDAPNKNLLLAPRQPPPGLVDALKLGFASETSRILLDEWVTLLQNVLPLLSDTLFQHLIPLVEIFCQQIDACFDGLKMTFQKSSVSLNSSEPAVIGLLNGLEQVLASAHDKLIAEESKKSTAKDQEQAQGFFGNVSNMTSGLFTGEVDKLPTRPSTANNRLAVLLCFQDTLRCCFKIWTWGVHGHQQNDQDPSSAASFSYTSLRLRKRALRVLENLFAAEALECLEILATIFCNPPSDGSKPEYILELLNILNGSRPKYMAPAIFNAIYRRINAESSRDSVQTSNLSATDLVIFLMEYVKSIEDDAMDEIWPDCMAFLKDILNNPLDYSQILPLLLSFVALIAEKVDNTNFGEQRKMRKELGDVFVRMLTATFTSLGTSGFLQDASQGPTGKARNAANGNSAAPRGQDFALTLASVMSKLPIILNDNERISVATSNVSANVIGPALRSKTFPRNMDHSFLELLLQVMKVSQGTKSWRKDVNDAFNDVKFFNIDAVLAQQYLVPIVRQLAVHDKERLPEILARITAPTTAGIMFGVGASSARMEADRKTQFNLRRIALLILASDEDSFADKYRAIEEKLTELMLATNTSSPSSATRAEVFMVLRALVLRSSSMSLTSFWPIINNEIQNAILSVLPDSAQAEQYSNASVMQACKVLDTLATLNLDDFQLHEWLFITDTIDAVYRPPNIGSTALADEAAEALGNVTTEVRAPIAGPQQHTGTTEKRVSFLEPLLAGLDDVEASEVKLLPRGDLATRVLQPFLGQLSILAFEATYEMLEADTDACEKALLNDIFEETIDA